MNFVLTATMSTHQTKILGLTKLGGFQPRYTLTNNGSLTLEIFLESPKSNVSTVHGSRVCHFRDKKNVQLGLEITEIFAAIKAHLKISARISVNNTRIWRVYLENAQ